MNWKLYLAAIFWFILFWYGSEPMWDEPYSAPLYPFLSDLLTPVVLHFILAIGGIFCFDQVFKPTWYGWYVMIVPYIAISTLQLSASIPPFVILLCLYAGWKYAPLAYIARTEFIVLGLLNKHSALYVTLAIALMIIFFVPISSNSPAVFYISLGQLPNNEWGITYADSTAQNIAGGKAWESPELFRKLAFDAIVSNPSEYVRKSFYNLYRVFHDGIYVGAKNPDMFEKFGQVLFGAWLWVAVLFCIPIWNRGQYREILILFVLIILMQVFGQQMARHTNVLYLPILGIASLHDWTLWHFSGKS